MAKHFKYLVKKLVQAVVRSQYSGNQKREKILVLLKTTSLTMPSKYGEIYKIWIGGKVRIVLVCANKRELV